MNQKEKNQLQPGDTINIIMSQIIFLDRTTDSNPFVDMFNNRRLFNSASNNSATAVVQQDHFKNDPLNSQQQR